jgi:methionyl-tRNA formyltransferase
MSFRVVFMGTPSFAEPTLGALMKGTHELVSVVTQPDRPVGRGRRLQASPVKERALAEGIRVLEPHSARQEEFISALRDLAPDVIVLAAFGQLLPEAVLHIPPQGCLNLHPSLLPKYRGAAPVQWAVINGEPKTGVTVFRMGRRMDAGDILLARQVSIGDEEDAAELSTRLSKLGARVIMETLGGLQRGTLSPVPQREEEATYARQLRKKDGQICWQSGAEQIERLVRGLVPWPGTYTSWRGRRLKVHKAKARQGMTLGKPGEVLTVNRRGLWVQTGEGYLDMLEVQLENRPKMPTTAFLQGNRDILGDFLGGSESLN